MSSLLAFALSLFITDAGDDARAALKRAEAQYNEAQYAEAVAALDEILARRDLAADQRREATIYLGMGHLALGHDEAAKARFRDVLEADVNYQLPRYTSPKIRGLFEQVREEVQSRPVISALPPAVTTAAAGPDHVRLRFRADRVGSHAALVFWRRRGQNDWSRAQLTSSTGLDGTPELAFEPPLGASAVAAGPGIDFNLQYYAEVREGERVLAHSASADSPLDIRVNVHGPSAAGDPNDDSKTERPFYKRWWFWTITGVVVAGTATAVYVGTRNDVSTGALDIHFMVGP